jgi:hypothetical protein
MAEKNEASPARVRITWRMTPQQWDLLRPAADVAVLPVSAFVLRSACQAAERHLIEQQPSASSAGVGSVPAFTKPARQRGESIPAQVLQRLLTNVCCGHCSAANARSPLSKCSKPSSRSFGM